MAKRQRRAFSHLYHTLGLVNTNAFSECHMALLGKRDGHAKVPYGTLGSERVKSDGLVILRGTGKGWRNFASLKDLHVCRGKKTTTITNIKTK